MVDPDVMQLQQRHLGAGSAPNPVQGAQFRVPQCTLDIVRFAGVKRPCLEKEGLDVLGRVLRAPEFPLARLGYPRLDQRVAPVQQACTGSKCHTPPSSQTWTYLRPSERS